MKISKENMEKSDDTESSVEIKTTNNIQKEQVENELR